jgi:hypothetical protein
MKIVSFLIKGTPTDLRYAAPAREPNKHLGLNRQAATSDGNWRQLAAARVLLLLGDALAF